MCCYRKGQLSCYNLNQSQMCKDETNHKSLPCGVPGMGHSYHSCHNSQIHVFSNWAAILHRLARNKPKLSLPTFSQEYNNEYQ